MLKNTLAIVATIAALLVTSPSIAQVSAGPFPEGTCVSQEFVIDYVVKNTSTGTIIEQQTDLVVVFSNPNVDTNYQVNFSSEGCAIDAVIVDKATGV